MTDHGPFAPVMIGGDPVSEPAEVVERYRPQPSRMVPHVWDEAGAAIRSWVLLAGYESPWAARGAIQTITAFVDWCLEQSLRLDPDEMLTPDRVEYWISHHAAETRSASTYRSRLRRVGRAATKRTDWPPRPRALVGRVPVLPPYTESEVAGFWEAANAQGTARQCRALTTVLTFGLGAGLKAYELAALEPGQVMRHATVDGLLAVRLPDRVVPLRQECAASAAEAAARTPSGGLVLSHQTRPGKDPLGKALQGVVLPERLPRLLMSRLRTTWAVTVLSAGVRVSEYLAISGATSGRTLAYLADYVPCRDESDTYYRVAAGITETT